MMGNRFSLWVVIAALTLSLAGFGDDKPDSGPGKKEHGATGTPLNPKRPTLSDKVRTIPELIIELNNVEFQEGKHQPWWFLASDLSNLVWESVKGDSEKFIAEMHKYEAEMKVGGVTDKKKAFGLQFLAASRTKEITELLVIAKNQDAPEEKGFEARAARQELLQRYKNPNALLLAELFGRGNEKSAEDAEKLMKLLADPKAFTDPKKALEPAQILAKLMGFLGKEQRDALNAELAKLAPGEPKDREIPVGGTKVKRSDLDTNLLKALITTGAVSVNMDKAPDKDGLDKEFHTVYKQTKKDNEEFWDLVARAKGGDKTAFALLGSQYDDADLSDYLGKQWKDGNQVGVVEAVKALGTKTGDTYSMNITQRGVDADQPQQIKFTLGKTDQEITASLNALAAAKRNEFEQGRPNPLPEAYVPTGFSAVSISRDPKFPATAKNWRAFQPNRADGKSGPFAAADAPGRAALAPVEPKNLFGFKLSEVKSEDPAKVVDAKLPAELSSKGFALDKPGLDKFLTNNHGAGSCASCHSGLQGKQFKFELENPGETDPTKLRIKPYKPSMTASITVAQLVESAKGNESMKGPLANRVNTEALAAWVAFTTAKK